VIDKADPLETSAQLRTVEIARNLQRIIDPLAAPHKDPRRLHRQLLDAQREMVAVLTDLNAIVGGLVPMP
jgi:hypothetical protein